MACSTAEVFFFSLTEGNMLWANIILFVVHILPPKLVADVIRLDGYMRVCAPDHER